MRLEQTIVIGSDVPVLGANFYLWANGWCGGFSREPLAFPKAECASHLPIGPYVAAGLIAGEMFKFARQKHYQPTKALFHSLWDYSVSEIPILGGPRAVAIQIDVALAGVGAVGCGFLHALWASDGVKGIVVLADNDAKGLELTNLNRYVIFGSSSVGTQKATAAASILSDARLTWIPHDSSFEVLQPLPHFVVSAVDKNAARIAIQSRCPARLFSASTLDLRAEVLRCGPPGEGACLACRNPPEKLESDEEVRARARNLSNEKLAVVSAEHGISIADAKEWIATGKCGTAGESLLRHLRVESGEIPFSVGFVSLLAGTMLASEVLKEHLPLRETSLSEQKQRGLFQYLLPFARTNQASEYLREPHCPVCDPNSGAFDLWKKRYNAFTKASPIV